MAELMEPNKVLEKQSPQGEFERLEYKVREAFKRTDVPNIDRYEAINNVLTKLLDYWLEHPGQLNRAQTRRILAYSQGRMPEDYK